MFLSQFGYGEYAQLDLQLIQGSTVVTQLLNIGDFSYATANGPLNPTRYAVPAVTLKPNHTLRIHCYGGSDAKVYCQLDTTNTAILGGAGQCSFSSSSAAVSSSASTSSAVSSSRFTSVVSSSAVSSSAVSSSAVSSSVSSCAPSSTSAAAFSDPLFRGCWGQSFYVGGAVGGVYSLLTSPHMQLNARFVYLRNISCPVVEGRDVSNCFQEQGTFFGSMALRVQGGHWLRVVGGAVQDGFASVQLHDGRTDSRGR